MNSEGRTVAVIALNWNGGDDILDCLKGVLDTIHKAIEIVVVENGSVDGSSDAIRRRLPQSQFINNPRNLGFAKGSNQGMERALERGIQHVLLSALTMPSWPVRECILVIRMAGSTGCGSLTVR